ncbi:MAG: hypothetical protein OER90_14240 [Gemmatimonadota bacterium]|nr:hypothetical protein [Gemmatimonadota bacterium]
MSLGRPSHVVLALMLAVIACSPEGSPTALPGAPLPGLSADELARFRTGQVQFDRVFTPDEGLGPLFNENQCAACHTDPASGGGGGVFVVKATRFTPPDACDRLESHGGENVRRQATPLARALGIEREAVPVEATEQGRFTPTFLFGLGLVEAIPDRSILEREDPEDADGDGVSGRAGRTPSGALGRFGRKAEAATLREFTDGALRLEMGLSTPLTPTESGYGGAVVPPGTDPVPEPEVDDLVLDRLVDFVRFLSPPARSDYGQAHRDSVARGARLFDSLGCTGCHVSSMTTGESEVDALDRKRVFLYSDLLLHDLGPEVADVCGITAAPSEVRTELLMGLRFRDAYIHDGRSHDLDDAIMRHGGEARRARDAYARLDPRARLLLMAFLNSL